MLSSLFGSWWASPAAAPTPDQPVIRHSFSKDKPSKTQDPKTVPHADQSFPVQKLQKQQTRIEKLLAINQERRTLEAKANARAQTHARFGPSEPAASTPANREFVQACLSVLDERNNDPDTVHPSEAPSAPPSQLSAEDLKHLRTDKSTTTGKQDLLRAHLKQSSGKISPQSGPSPTAASLAAVSLPPHPSNVVGSRSNNAIASAAVSAAKAATADRRPSLPRANSRSPASSESNIITSKPKQAVSATAAAATAAPKKINILYNPKNLTAQENYDLTPVPYQYQSPYVAADSPATADATAIRAAVSTANNHEEIDPEQLDAELDPSVSADNPITVPASPSRLPMRPRPEAAAPQARGGDVLNVHSLTMREMLYNPKFVGNENYDLTPIPFPHLAHHT